MREQIKQISIGDLLTNLTVTQKEGIFREVQTQYVRNDIISHAKEKNLYLAEDIIDAMASAYVSGEYDCNVSYWNNIDNLIAKYNK